MVRSAAFLVLGILLGVFGNIGWHKYSDNAVAKKLTPLASGAQRVADQVERYKQRNNTYPKACNAAGLFMEIGDFAAMSSASDSPVYYCSDGEDYLLAYLPLGPGPISSQFAAPIVLAKSRWVAWPGQVSLKPPSGGNRQ